MEIGPLVVFLLRAAWVSGTVPIVIASLPFSKLGSFHKAVLGFARRGKTLQSSSKRKLTVPQRFFSHFYVLAVFWTTFLLVATWFYAYKMVPSIPEKNLYSTIASYLTGGAHVYSLGKPPSTTEHIYMVWQSLFLLLLMEVQVLRRLYETIYVFKYSPSARMHIFGYLAGLFFYTAAPLSLCCSYMPEVFNFIKELVLEFIVKGKDRMSVPDYDLLGLLSPMMSLRWYAWTGAVIFLWGWIHQRRCHAILGSLRENSDNEEEYVIPHGDWFKYVSSPHYLAEIVIYGGMVIASGGADLTVWLLFGFVVANLAFASGETHRWYQHKFEDYPRCRSAIIPFIF